jgi:hypothetical protein
VFVKVRQLICVVMAWVAKVVKVAKMVKNGKIWITTVGKQGS